MSRKKAVITGVAGYLPDHVLTNADLEKMVDTTDEWIRTRTGIEERRILKDPNLATSDMAVQAVKTLLKKTGTLSDEIDLIIVATVTSDHRFPDTAVIVADKAELTNAFGFDVVASCSGFLFALSTGAQYIESGRLNKVIVVGADAMSRIIDYEDRATCIIFGDGAGAVLLESSYNNGIQDFLFYGNGAGRAFLHMKAGGSLHPPTKETVENKEHFVYQDGRTVFKHAVKGMAQSITAVMQKNNLSKDEIDWIFPHQANIRIIQAVAEYLEFPMERVMVNIHKYGNTTAGTLPLCLNDYESKLKKGDKIILTAFGGGFSWGATYLTWGY